MKAAYGIAVDMAELLTVSAASAQHGAPNPERTDVKEASVELGLARGPYTVRWQAIAADGAQGSSSFSFMYSRARSTYMTSSPRCGRPA